MEFVYPKSVYNREEQCKSDLAKEQLILQLKGGHITATGYEGWPTVGRDGRVDSMKIGIAPIHWQSELSVQNWADNVLKSTMSGHEELFTCIGISTDDLFMTFPHRDMEAVLVGHEFNDYLPRTLREQFGKKSKIRGRKPGDGSYDDGPHLDRMTKLIESGDAKSSNNAAGIVAPDALGQSFSSKVSRLGKKHRKLKPK
jgi:hypothetical protein